MSQLPNLVISSLDASRLEGLLFGPKALKGGDTRALEVELERAEIVDPENVPANVVTMNSRVRFLIVETGETFTQTLVYPDRTGSVEDAISILAPVGSAMLGLAEGDSIAWPRPNGRTLTVRIDEILFQPERAGELHR